MNEDFKKMIKDLIDSFIDEEKPPLWYGDTVYVVEPIYQKAMSSPCPVCNDKRTIIHNGYEIKCSYCRDSYGYSNNQIFVRHYVLRPYTVNDVHIRVCGDQTNVFFKKKKTPRLTFTCSAFCRLGNSYKDTKDIDHIRLTENFSEKYLVQEIKRGERFYFKSKGEAEAALEMIHTLQERKIAEFNEKYNTSHVYQFRESGQK